VVERAAISQDTMDDQMNGREGDVLFVNGVVNPTMTLRPGETRRLRVLNASAARYYLLNVPDHQLVTMRVDTHAKLGATEVWTVRNDADMDHPFHLHGFQFQVIDRNGTPEPVVAWTDTLNLPTKTGPGGEARFARDAHVPLPHPRA
jgi:FtsP/CotA-like multicopper oxidase with cupredoxin domain